MFSRHDPEPRTLRLFLFSAFRIPISEFLSMPLSIFRIPHSDFRILIYAACPNGNVIVNSAPPSGVFWAVIVP